MQSQWDLDTELPACSFKNWRMHPESSGGAESGGPRGWGTTAVFYKRTDWLYKLCMCVILIKIGKLKGKSGSYT